MARHLRPFILETEAWREKRTFPGPMPDGSLGLLDPMCTMPAVGAAVGRCFAGVLISARPCSQNHSFLLVLFLLFVLVLQQPSGVTVLAARTAPDVRRVASD